MYEINIIAYVFRYFRSTGMFQLHLKFVLTI